MLDKLLGRRRSHPQGQPTLSVIIPALNEEAHIAATLASIFSGAALAGARPEVLVVDGGSQDNTCALAKRSGAKQVQQRVATTDSPAAPPEPPSGRPRARKLPVWGCSSSIVATGLPQWQVGLLQAGVALRTRLLRLPFGDQALFVRREVLQQLHGFHEHELLEDVDLVKRLNRLSPPTIIDSPVITSGRRWQQLGFVRTFMLNQATLAAWVLGVPPQTLATWYYHKSNKDLGRRKIQCS